MQLEQLIYADGRRLDMLEHMSQDLRLPGDMGAQMD